MVKRSVSVDNKLDQLVVKLRYQERPPLKYSQMICKLAWRGSIGYTQELEKPVEQQIRQAQTQAETVTEALPPPEDIAPETPRRSRRKTATLKPKTKKRSRPKKIIAKAVPQQIYCGNCGIEIESTFSFCDGCGYKIEIVEQ